MLAEYIGGPRMEADGRCRYMHDSAPQTGPGDRRLQLVLGRARLPRQVDRIRASVFVVHGLNDFNVKTKAFAEWWYRLAPERRARKIWLHNGGHGGPGGAGATATGRRRTAGSTTSCSACRTEIRASRARPSSARTAPTPTRPTGLRRARAGQAAARSALNATAPGTLRPAPEWVRQPVRRPGAQVRYRRRTDPGARRGADRTGSSTARPRSPPTSASAGRRGST